MKHYYLDKAGLDYIADPKWDKGMSFWYRLRNALDFKKKLKYWRLKHKYGFDVRETWNVDTEMFNWIYEHICHYLVDHGYVDIEDPNTPVYKGLYLKQTLELLKKLLEDYLLYDKRASIEDDLDKLIKEENIVINTEEDNIKCFRKAIYLRKVIENQNKEKEDLYNRIFEILKIALPHIWW